MRIRIRSDPLIFGPQDPYPVLFSWEPDPDPTCNNVFIKLLNKIYIRINKFKLEIMVYISNFMPTYLKYKYIFFLPFDFRSETKSDPDPDFFLQAESDPDSDPWKKKCRILIPRFQS